MHRHAFAVPRLTRGSHKKAREITDRPLYWSKGNRDPLPYNPEQTLERLADETSFRKRVRLAGRVATQAFYRTREKGRHDIQQVGPWLPRRGTSSGGVLKLTRSVYDLVDKYGDSREHITFSPAAAASILEHRAEALAGTPDDAPLYLWADEIVELDNVELVPYPTQPSGRQWSGSPQLAPASSAQLYQRLLDMINAPLRRTDPRPSSPVYDLIRYHEIFPMHSSAKTYNLLVEQAIRHTLFRTAWRLIQRMRTHGLEPDLETEKLAVRLLIRVGRWNDAWVRCFQPSGAAYAWAQHYPLPFWVEFFGFVSPAINKWGRARFWKIERSAEVQANVLRQLLQHIPNMTSESFDQTSPRLVGALVYHMLRLQQRGHALSVARAFLQSLPSDLHARINRQAMALVDLFAAFRAESTYSHAAIRATFEELMALHPDLRPGETSLCLLMRSLAGRREGGRVALRLLEDARARWGTRVEGPSVRRIVARLAFDSRRRDIVFAMFRRQEHYKWHGRFNDPAVGSSHLLFREVDARERGRQRRMPTQLLRRGFVQESTKWVSLRRAVEREWGKRWFEEELARDGDRRRHAETRARNSINSL